MRSWGPSVLGCCGMEEGEQDRTRALEVSDEQGCSEEVSVTDSWAPRALQCLLLNNWIPFLGELISIRSDLSDQAFRWAFRSVWLQGEAEPLSSHPHSRTAPDEDNGPGTTSRLGRLQTDGPARHH